MQKFAYKFSTIGKIDKYL